MSHDALLLCERAVLETAVVYDEIPGMLIYVEDDEVRREDALGLVRVAPVLGGGAPSLEERYEAWMKAHGCSRPTSIMVRGVEGDGLRVPPGCEALVQRVDAASMVLGAFRMLLSADTRNDYLSDLRNIDCAMTHWRVVTGIDAG